MLASSQDLCCQSPPPGRMLPAPSFQLDRGSSFKLDAEDTPTRRPRSSTHGQSRGLQQLREFLTASSYFLSELARFLQRDYSSSGFANCFFENLPFSFRGHQILKLHRRHAFLDRHFKVIIHQQNFENGFPAADSGVPAKIAFSATPQHPDSTTPTRWHA